VPGEPLLWPLLAALGFLLINMVVVALAASSTARYEFGRNRVRVEERVAASHSGTGAAPGAPSSPASTAAQRSELQQQVAVSVAAHPAGKLAGSAGTTVGWWLVGEPDAVFGDGAEVQVFAGPFADRIEADWAALSAGLPAIAVWGVRPPGGGIVPRTSPQERAWLGELGEHLDHLDDDWDALLSDTDPLTTLAVEVTAALVEAGLALHDCAGASPAGGVCLTPASGFSGILVSWHQHDRMSRELVRGPAADAAVQHTMNAAVADVLTHLGFRVESLGSAGAHLVTAPEV
jgi:hypothetical protein